MVTMNIVCVSHLRWDFVYQRPQHLLTRAAGSGRVFYIEEPRFGDGPPSLEVRRRESRLHVAVPLLPAGLSPVERAALQAEMLTQCLDAHGLSDFRGNYRYNWLDEHFRAFHAEVGVTPAAYVERTRLETARRLLESTARSVEDVAAGAGFGTPEALRRAFARRIGLSPREYSARFAGGEA